MLPALRVCLCRAGDAGSTRLGGNHRIISYDAVVSHGVWAPAKLGPFCLLAVAGDPPASSEAAAGMQRALPLLGSLLSTGAVARPGSRAGGVSAPGGPDNLFWLCPGSTAPGSAVTTAGTRSRTRRSCSACWPSRSRGRRSSSWGAGIAPGSALQLPPTRCPTTPVAPAEADG